MNNEFNNPFGFDISIGNQHKLNNTNTDELRKKYNIFLLHKHTSVIIDVGWIYPSGVNFDPVNKSSVIWTS